VIFRSLGGIVALRFFFPRGISIMKQQEEAKALEAQRNLDLQEAELK